MSTVPDIDPHAYQVETHTWGEEVYILVNHDGDYYAWIESPMGGTQVHRMPSEGDAREHLAEQRAGSMLAVAQNGPAGDDRVKRHVLITDPASGWTLRQIDCIDGASDGLWVVSGRYTGPLLAEYDLVEYDDRDEAEGAWAELVERHAEQLRMQPRDYVEILADMMRCRAYEGRAATFRARAGDKLRKNEDQIKGHRDMPSVAQALGVSREYLYRVMNADEWI